MKIFLIFLFFAINAAASITKDVKSWPRATLPEFGCFLEKEFGYKDVRFNCSLKNYKNAGDPCKNTEAYYEGITFPEKYVKKINPAIKSIDLSWEHGELQSVSLSFKSKLATKKIRHLFKLPVNENGVHANIMSYSIQDCHKSYNCLTLQGFDHMGAGDVDCGDHSK